MFHKSQIGLLIAGRPASLSLLLCGKVVNQSRHSGGGAVSLSSSPDLISAPRCLQTCEGILRGISLNDWMMSHKSLLILVLILGKGCEGWARWIIVDIWWNVWSRWVAPGPRLENKQIHHPAGPSQS